MLPKQENLLLARRLALQAISGMDLSDRAARSGCRLETDPWGRKRMSLAYLGREIACLFPEGTIELRDQEMQLSPREEILILHYLEKAQGIPCSGEWISFAEISGGTFYHPVFLQRCKAPLVKFFGENPGSLLSLAQREFRGEPWSMGDVGVKIRALPFVALGLVLWRGDAEFPPDGNILFDSSVTGYLPVEDIVILAETVVWKLVKNFRVSNSEFQVKN